MHNVRKLYLIRFFGSLIPAYVIERLFWESRGMTIQMVTYTEIIFAATVVLLEVPTGMLADRWGRKQMLLLSACLYAAELLLLVYAHAFWHFALAILLAGISRSASSGAENAFLYDCMLADGRAENFEKVLGRINALDLTAAILAALVGGWLAGTFELELHYWLSVASVLIVIVLTATLAEVRAETEDDEGKERKPLLDYLRTSIRFFKTHADVRSVVFTGMVIGSSVSFLYEFWQIYLARLAVPVAYFGLFSALVMLLGLPGNLLAHRLLVRYGARPLHLAATLLASVGFFFAAFVHHPVSLAAMLLTSLAAGIAEPIATGYLHHRIGDSSMRATIDSFQSLGLNAVLAASAIGFGLASAHFDVFGGYGFVGALCAAYAIWNVCSYRNKAT
ncbi:MFS transporter [Paenibacillus methanolicus]|nr:MFS transporter [Paenibacillus methanolicus]